LAAFLWEPMRREAEEHMGHGLPEMEAIQLAGDAVISRQIASTSMPKRFSQMARDIWSLQVRLKKIAKRPFKVLSNNRFRAAYDFLLLRAQAGEQLSECIEYWTQQQLEESMPIINKPRSDTKQNRRRRRRPRDKD